MCAHTTTAEAGRKETFPVSHFSQMQAHKVLSYAHKHGDEREGGETVRQRSKREDFKRENKDGERR